MNLESTQEKLGAQAGVKGRSSSRATRVWRDVKSKLAEQNAWGSKQQDCRELVEAERHEQSMPEGLPRDDAQRDQKIKRTLARFIRNKNAPEELEMLRHNLIVARVLSGLDGTEAAERFGYANSTQLSLIESGGRPVPKDWKFLRQAAQVYAVSVDFLLGLSPHTDFDAKVGQQFAMMRHMEEVVGGIAQQLATAMVQFSEDQQITAGQCERLDNAIVRVDESLDRLRSKHGFDDMPGTAPHLAAVETLREVAEPIRHRLRKRLALQNYIADVKAGRLPVIPHLRERYSRDGVRAEMLAESMDKENQLKQ